MGGVHELARPALVAVATAAAALLLSIAWQGRRHHQLVAALRYAGSPGRLANHDVDLVPGLRAPCVAGIRDARIYCPPDLAEALDDDELRAVILHERHHQLAHAPVKLVVLAGLSPIVGRIGAGSRWIERRRADIEIAADEYALREGASRPDLASALLKVGAADLASGLPGYASASDLRLRHLLGEAEPARRTGSALMAAALPMSAFLVCLILGLLA